MGPPKVSNGRGRPKAPMGPLWAPKSPNGAPQGSRWGPLRALIGPPKGPDGVEHLFNEPLIFFLLSFLFLRQSHKPLLFWDPLWGPLGPHGDPSQAPSPSTPVPVTTVTPVTV
jgi:hypothetical protein